QPFIENAIWHGIVPKGKGKVSVKVDTEGDDVICEIDDNGIGREVSRKNKSVTPVAHQSKGINISQARLTLETFLSDKNANITIKDKHENGTATGTTVAVRFNLQ
ncbi:MAG TPA: ATP-binding protein, partial [Chitinophagaceae bacterium]